MQLWHFNVIIYACACLLLQVKMSIVQILRQTSHGAGYKLCRFFTIARMQWWYHVFFYYLTWPDIHFREESTDCTLTPIYKCNTKMETIWPDKALSGIRMLNAVKWFFQIVLQLQINSYSPFLFDVHRKNASHCRHLVKYVWSLQCYMLSTPLLNSLL